MELHLHRRIKWQTTNLMKKVLFFERMQEKKKDTQILKHKAKFLQRQFAYRKWMANKSNRCFGDVVLLLSHVQLFCNSMDCSPLGSSVHGILQARTPECVAIPISKGSSWTKDRTYVSCIGKWILYHCATREVLAILWWNTYQVRLLGIPLHAYCIQCSFSWDYLGSRQYCEIWIPNTAVAT